jgi:hypothetical protein
MQMNIQRHSFKTPKDVLDPLGQIMAMQEIEGNPLTAEEVEMFQMFDREGWSSEKQQAFLDERFAAWQTSKAG